MSELNVFVGRQPIFDCNGNIYAYELLYRNSEVNQFPNINPEKATIELLIHTFLTIGIDRLVGQSKSFINFSEKLLKNDIIHQLNPKFVVVEILEDVEITPSLIPHIVKLKEKGFKIVLDDFVLKSQNDTYEQLMKLTNIIKVDFLHTSLEERSKVEQFVKRYPNVSLLAEKIETEDEYEEAKKLGYHLFQGFYFARPEIVKGSDIPTNHALYLHLFQKLNDDEANIDYITQLFMHDVSLSYKLLRYINSLAFDIPVKINSIKQAIMLMGLNKARKWMQILLLHDIGKGVGMGREKALINNSLTRAKICELIAKHHKKQDADKFFLAGMFSLINVIMKQNWEDILPKISLTDEINRTFLGEQTEITPYIQISEALEKLDMDLIDKYAQELGLSGATISDILKQAHKWTTHFD